MLICICGKSGSGKSYITNILSSLDDRVFFLDIDKIGHESIQDETIKNVLINYFGKDILNNGFVDRKKLGTLVFNSKEKMKKLEEFTWGYMERRIDEVISNHQSNIIILDYFYLPKTKYFNEADLKILVEVPFEERLRRAMLRDSITEENFRERESASIEYNPNDFDYVINNLDRDKTKEMVKSLYDKSIVSRKF